MAERYWEGVAGGPPLPPFSIGIRSAHAALRTRSSCLALNLVGAFFIALLRFPAFPRVIDVSFGVGALATGVLLLAFNLANIAYWTAGLCRIYYWADLVEGLVVEGFCAILVLASGNVIHFVWLFYLFHVTLTGTVGVTVRNLLVILVGPVTVAGVLALRGSSASALVGALVGVLGVTFYHVVGRMNERLEQGRAREALLEGEMARLQVAQERIRIARDLHDGVAAELSALVWRARVLAQSGNDPRAADDLSVFERRTMTALNQLRDVVLGLRAEPSGWPEATAALADQCRDLCRSDLELDFSADGELDTRAHAGLWIETQRIALELVRNASRHARGRHVQVRVRAADVLELRIADDGCGMRGANWQESRGGLANVRARVEELLGQMQLQSCDQGTNITVRLPLSADLRDARA